MLEAWLIKCDNMPESIDFIIGYVIGRIELLVSLLVHKSLTNIAAIINAIKLFNLMKRKIHISFYHYQEGY